MTGDERPASASRRAFLLSTSAALAAAHAAPRVTRDGRRLQLTGLAPYGVCEPMFEAQRLALVARGETWSAAYVQGLAGAAFRIAGICPCAPTCSVAMEPLALVQRLGYAAEVLPLDGRDADPAAQLATALAWLRAELEAGRPVPVWNVVTNAEWDLVCGYDEATDQLLAYGSYAGSPDAPKRADARRILSADICPPLGVLRIGARHAELDLAAAEEAALREAVRHAHAAPPAGGRGLREGLACYDHWVAGFRAPGRRLESGDSYCLGVYRSTHRAAAGFLRELAPRRPAAAAELERGAAAFTREADALDQAVPLLGWGCPAVDPVRDARAAELLQGARDAYAAGIAAVAAALAAWA